MSHLQAMIRTTFVYKVTVPILGSQRLTYYYHTILPINTSRVISYNTLAMAFVTTFNCNTVDNIYVKNM